MKATYTLDDWIKDRLAAEEWRLERARVVAESITTNRADAYASPEPKSFMLSTPSIMDEHERRWCETQIKFYKWW